MDRKTGINLFWAGGLAYGFMGYIAAKSEWKPIECWAIWQILYVLCILWMLEREGQAVHIQEDSKQITIPRDCVMKMIDSGELPPVGVWYDSYADDISNNHSRCPWCPYKAVRNE